MRRIIETADGGYTIPINGRQVTLREPTLREYAIIRELAHNADRELGDLPDSPSVEQVRERQDQIYTQGGPYARVMVEVVRMLAGEEIDVDDLPAFCANPTTVGWLLAQWSTPLVGDQPGVGSR